MRIFVKIFSVLFILSSCAQEAAKVEYHLNEFYGFNPDGESVAVLKTGENVIGPEAISAAVDKEYAVDNYEAPSKIEVSELDNLDPEVAEAKAEYERSIRNQPMAAAATIEINKPKTRTKTINLSGKTHTVQKGETLYALSRQYNIPILPIVIANNLSVPYNLSVGQKINIPKARFHEVESEETLYSISRTYGVDMSALVKANRLEEPYNVKLGQKLQIPFPTYQPEPNFVIDEATIASKNISTGDEVGGIEMPEEKSSNDNEIEGEIDLKTKEAETFNPEGLAIMIPPTLKPVEKKAPTYKTALLRKELSKKRKKKQEVYKDDGKFMWPVKGKLAEKFGMQKNNEYNDGIYVSAPAGAFVKASLSGRVVYTGDSLKSYGNLVIIKHNNGLLSAYAHLSKINVKKDDYIKKGQKIGTVGQTGKVKSPQLYFAIRKGKEARDPMMYLR